MISQDFIEELRSRADVVDTIASYVQLERRGRTYKGLCPFHNEKTPSFIVYPDTQSFYCFGCGAGGDTITFIRKQENLDYVEAIKYLAGRLGMEVPEDKEDRGASSRKRIAEANKLAARFFFDCLNTEDGREARGYLRSRGLSDSTIKRFGIGYSPKGWNDLRDYLKSKGFREDELVEAGLCARGRNNSVYDFFRNRVMFPVIDIRGNVVAFSGRRLKDEDSPRKYVNTGETPVFKKSKVLFGMNIAKNSGSRKIVLAEGQMDAIAMHQAGVDNAVAALGTALTADHAKIISQYADEVIIAYDSDEAGKKATERAISIFKPTPLAVRVLTIKGAKDADEFIKRYGAESFRAMLDGSDNSIEYQLKIAAQGLDLSTDSGVIAYLKSVTEVLSHCRSATERDVYAGKIADQLKVVSKKAILDQAEDTYRRRARAQKRAENKSLRDVTAQYNLKPYESGKLAEISSEQRLLGLLFMNPDLAPKVKAKMAGAEFSTEDLARLYRVIMAQIEDGSFNGFASLSPCIDAADMSRIAGIVAAVNGMNFPTEDIDHLTSKIRKAGLSPNKDTLKGMDPSEIQKLINKR